MLQMKNYKRTITARRSVYSSTQSLLSLSLSLSRCQISGVIIIDKVGTTLQAKQNIVVDGAKQYVERGSVVCFKATPSSKHAFFGYPRDSCTFSRASRSGPCLTTATCRISAYYIIYYYLLCKIVLEVQHTHKHTHTKKTSS